MKKVLIAAACSLSLVAVESVQAQDLESVKKNLLLTKYKEAKADIDKVVANPKHSSKPETWLMKSAVYSSLATSKGVAATDSVAYLKEAIESLNKYAEMDPAKSKIADPQYADVPRQLYVAYFNAGISKFNTKEWQGAYNDLRSAADMSDYLIKSKVLTGPIDTNAVLYTGAAAQNAKMDEEAVKWYSRLADAKVGGKDNEFIYQFTTDYYLRKKDEANFKKYQDLGKQLYPESKYFSAIASDYARSSGNFNDIIKYYDEKVAANPSDYATQYEFGAEIFDYLNPRGDSAKVPTGNDVAAWEQKMVGAFTKAGEIKSDKGLPLAIIGSHYARKAEAVNKKIEEVGVEMRNANKGAKPDKTGKLPPVPKALLNKRDSLYKDYYSLLDQAGTYFQQATDRFSKQAALEPIEKQFYKNAAGTMIDLSDMRAKNAKGKPADQAKFTADKKKWEDVYDNIK